MSLYYDDDAPKTLKDISDTLRRYSVNISHDIRVLRIDLDDAGKKTDPETASQWANVVDEAESLRYLADKLGEISYAFDIINRTVYNPSEEGK